MFSPNIDCTSLTAVAPIQIRERSAPFSVGAMKETMHPILRFHGAAHGVTGSCYEIETGAVASLSTAAFSRV